MSSADEQAESRSFQWPPPESSSDATDSPATSVALEPASQRTRPIDVFREFEHTFMGVATTSFEERAAQTGWLADGADAYCARCGHTVGPHEYSEADGCTRCESKRLPWDRAVRLGAYNDLLRDAILETKFTRWRHVGEQLGRRLGASLASALAAKGHTPADAVLVPVPSSTRRRLARGIDHTLVIARGARRATGIEIQRSLSARFGPTQVGTPSSRRDRNVSDRFRLKRGAQVSGRIAVLIDDVRTTGATLRTAARTLAQAHPVSIWIATVAVAEA